MTRAIFRMSASRPTETATRFSARCAIRVFAPLAALVFVAAVIAPLIPLTAYAAQAKEPPAIVGPAMPAQPAQPAAPPKNGEKPKPAPKPTPRPVPTTWHATVFFSGSSQYRIIHYWSSGSSMRAETLITGHPVVTIVHGDRYIVMDRLSGKALDIERAKRATEEDETRLRPFGIELDEIRKLGAEKVEETRLSGVAVEVWRLTDNTSRRTVWVTKDAPRVPLRAETFVRGSSETLVFDYSNWAFDMDMPDEFFEIPSDYDVEELDYDEYEEKSAKEQVGPGPILYPDLLHGGRP